MNRANLTNLFLILVIFAALGYRVYAPVIFNPVPQPPANAAELKNWQEPKQKNLSGKYGKKYKGGQLAYMATYEITARILGKKYYDDGRYAQIAPLDLALGWKYMSEPVVYKKLDIQNYNREYHYKGLRAIAQEDIIHNSANVHIIPANKEVWEALRSFKVEDMITIRGYLVNFFESSSFHTWKWNSSLVRTDVGDGACELIYVLDVEKYIPPS